MFKIKKAEFLSADVKLFEIVAPEIAKRRQAGQFIILRLDEQGERIPLTIADSNPEQGTVTIIVQGIGKTTKSLNQKESGDSIMDVVGPLGKASHMEKFGTAVCIGGGVGSAIAYPTAVALKEAGNHVITINGARNKDLIILEEEMKQFSDESYITTDDGSYGHHGFVTDILQKLIDEKRELNFVLAIGPIPMMRAVAEATRPHNIQTVVSLNPIMIDGTGMCGGCRVLVDGDSKFACVDGPEFDGHKVDFTNLINRNRIYQGLEQESLKQHECQLLEQADKKEE
ncbi:MAG: sulfide/dihydroorotate dehydrogenase-like FAD/NAD-binding protein [Bdellovibrionales bacterium]|nr:sulfide/dihydroorotate dehydrogenase-like FAD/NAD-binding protein [Bdellovibrionales bacterium]MBT3524871.1 sulfide/dihydroorotate dehydrogenase-like FAD/NAD-binding protein [Bdellovibrionales bacterium]MBT7766625.1 sulfide/dihydroorotate dehydrogenase-like FAD/NAD-binding protein [Bdellovibrionales bacterium]